MPASIWKWGKDPAPLEETLERGGVLAIPTESSYGLAVDPRSAAGVAAVFRVKHRPADRPLPVVLGDLEQASLLGIERDTAGLEKIAPLWPAPLSLVVEISSPIPASAGLSTLAVRVPDHDRLRRLLRRLGPLTATSANASGEAPLTDPRSVLELLVEVEAWLVDDGVLPGGPPSTLVRWRDGKFRVLRAGRYPVERIDPSPDRGDRR